MGVQADKQYGAKGKKVVNDDSIIHCGMDVQRRMHEAHLQVCPHPPLPLFPLPPPFQSVMSAWHLHADQTDCLLPI